MLKHTIPAIAVAICAALPFPVAAAAARSDGSMAASPAVTAAVTSVPAEVFDAVGAGPAADRRFSVRRLTQGSAARPDVLSINAAWCPDCAANSWPLAIALSRFGRLTGLRQIDTGTTYRVAFGARPSYDHTRGLSFVAARLDSPYVRFSPVVIYDVRGRPLHPPTRPQAERILAFDPHGDVPAVAVGKAFGLVEARYSPGWLKGLSWEQTAARLSDPTSTLGRRIVGEANLLTAAICAANGQRPDGVCRSAGVVAAAAGLPRR